MNIFTFHSLHYSPVCAQYSDFLYKAQLLTQKLLDQTRLCCSSVEVFAMQSYGRHHELVDHYEISIPRVTMELSPYG